MEVKIPVRISNRHVHLTKETYELIFDNELTKRNDLSQIGQFAANETVTLSNQENILENVRIVGPLRNYNQIELSKSDARKLKLNPPVRSSGDILNTPNITIKTEKNTINISGVIIADRHVHMNEEIAQKYGLTNKQKVQIKIDGDKSGVIDAFIKVTTDGVLELHIDTDDANAFLINDKDIVTMIY